MTTRFQMLLTMILLMTLGLGAYSFLQISAATSGPIATPITIDVAEAILTDVDGETQATHTEPILTLGIQVDTGWQANLVVEPEIQVDVPGTLGEAGQGVVASPVIFEIAPVGSEAPQFSDKDFKHNPNPFVETIDYRHSRSDCHQS